MIAEKERTKTTIPRWLRASWARNLSFVPFSFEFFSISCPCRPLARKFALEVYCKNFCVPLFSCANRTPTRSHFRDDLPSMSKRKLLPFRSRRPGRRHFCRLRAEVLAVPHVRQEIPREAGGDFFRPLRALSPMREFRFGPRVSESSRLGAAHFAQALARFSVLSLRSLPAEVFQRTTCPAHRSFNPAFEGRTRSVRGVARRQSLLLSCSKASHIASGKSMASLNSPAPRSHKPPSITTHSPLTYSACGLKR